MVLLLGIFGPMLLPNPRETDVMSALMPPGSPGHPLGTDPLGRDILAWIASGIRTALVVSLSVALISAVLGTAVGLVGGYYGGIVDTVLMRLVDLQLAVPPLLLFITGSVVAGDGFFSLILLLSVVGWVPYARVVRSKILADRERSHIAAARLAGAGGARILLLHLLPGAATLVFVLASLQAGLVLLWESGLSFLGLGLQPPNISLGFIVAQGRDYLAQEWWIVTLPGLAIALLVLGFNLLGDGMRDTFQISEEAVDR